MADDTARDADEFLKYLSETEHEIPYSKRAIGIFLEAIAAAIAGIVAIAPDNRTPTTYLAILSRELSYRNRALAGHLDLPTVKTWRPFSEDFGEWWRYMDIIVNKHRAIHYLSVRWNLLVRITHNPS